jgi:hypothetical protein
MHLNEAHSTCPDSNALHGDTSGKPALDLPDIPRLGLSEYQKHRR